MNLFDLNHDILEHVVDEVFRWRKKVCAKELRSEWRRRRGRRHMVRSRVMRGEAIVHEGRGMLCDTDYKASTLGKIFIWFGKYFICGIQAFPFIETSILRATTKFGISLRIGRSQGVLFHQLIDLGLKNGWDMNGCSEDHHSVVRYLMDKEEERTD